MEVEIDIDEAVKVEEETKLEKLWNETQSSESTFPRRETIILYLSYLKLLKWKRLKCRFINIPNAVLGDAAA